MLRSSTSSAGAAVQPSVSMPPKYGKLTASMPSWPSARLRRRRVSAPLLAFSSMFHLPFSPQRKTIEPFGTTIGPLLSS
ncbi:hypothetical protein G6F22_020783 [Rhizopus arrhizus]|nr:hypothetical protein G6F22_020783 [Rhizopus arrhizus]